MSDVGRREKLKEINPCERDRLIEPFSRPKKTFAPAKPPHSIKYLKKKKQAGTSAEELSLHRRKQKKASRRV